MACHVREANAGRGVQVDVILHPLKSELNFPIGQKVQIVLRVPALGRGVGFRGLSLESGTWGRMLIQGSGSTSSPTIRDLCVLHLV